MEEQHIFKNIIENLKLKFDFSRKNSPTTKTDNSKTYIDKSKKSLNVKQQTINQGLSYFEVKEIVNDIIDQRMLDFKNEAECTYKMRVLEFRDNLLEDIKKLPEKELLKLKEPDVQLAIFEATKISGKREFKELREVLSSLVLNRIKNTNTDSEELKNIVYDEAIKTIEKVTINQLKIIAACFFLRYRYSLVVQDIATFRKDLKDNILPFLDFKSTNAEFQHIEYTGCGSINIDSLSMIAVFKNAYAVLFLKSLSEDEYNSLNIQDELKKELLVKDQEKNKYNFIIRNEHELKELLERKSVNIEIINGIISTYKSFLKADNEIRSELLSIAESEKVLEVVEKTQLKNLRLTSVGIAIAATFIEQNTLNKLNIDVWIK